MKLHGSTTSGDEVEMAMLFAGVVDVDLESSTSKVFISDTFAETSLTTELVDTVTGVVLCTVGNGYDI